MPIVDSTLVPLSGPTAHRLADLVGVERDLRWTAAVCAALVHRQAKLDDLAREGMHDAALIRYGRCFKEGKRGAFRIPHSWIDELPPKLRDAHDEALHVRDKHIAHSVNDWELNVPVAQVVRVKEYGAATVRSVSVSHQRVVSLSLNSLRLLQDLATTLANRVATTEAEVQVALLKEAREVPPRELERRAPKFPQAGHRKVNAPRHR